MKNPYGKAFYDHNKDASQTSATAILSIILEDYHPRNVLDVGCGIGTWGKAAKQLGLTYTGIDGEHVDRSELLIDATEFRALDLTRPFKLDEQFELVICMEVAEHLAADTAIQFVHSLCSHAPVVLFSAAIPYQGGSHHVNERWPSYWAALFAAEGYSPFDAVRPRIWAMDRVAEYYKQNSLVYVKNGTPSLTELFTRAVARAHFPIDIVHPDSYTLKANPRNWPVASMVKSFPSIVARVVRNRILPR